MFNSNPNCLLKSKRDSQSLYLPEKQKQKAIKTQNDTGEKKSLGVSKFLLNRVIYYPHLNHTEAP